MGPKKERSISIKRDNVGRGSALNLDSPINTDSWKCVVLMAVEKSVQDKFLLKEFEEEAKTQKRPKIQLISYSGILKIIHDIVKGEVHHKFAFLSNFSSVFQEAGEYLSTKREIPVYLQVKLIKTMLLYFKEESLIKIEKESLGQVDPIKAMADRPTTLGAVEIKKKDAVKKGDNGLKVRPPSYTKTETQLLKRGEGAKEDQCIVDAPINGYFSLYVLLIEFYSPELPLALINANVPLHGLLCVDTSLSDKESNSSFTRFKSNIRLDDVKEDCVQKFWQSFLGFLWDPETSYKFRDFISEVYTPRGLLCEKKKRREFIYRELSYLLYDMSGYKERLDSYLANMKLWEVEELIPMDTNLVIEDIPNECVTVPVILQSMMDAICGNDLSETTNSESFSDVVCSFDSANESEHAKTISPSIMPKFGSFIVHPEFSFELLTRGDQHSMNVYLKTKSLDIYYNLFDVSALDYASTSTSENHTSCRYNFKNNSPNMQEIFKTFDSELWSIRERYQFEVNVPEIDYILYSVLMTRVHCAHQIQIPRSIPSNFSSKKASDFSIIENLDGEMTKPHFTITDGSRHILKSIPYNVKDMSKDFFRPSCFKVVSPAKVKASSLPTGRVLPPLTVQRSFMSDVVPWLTDLPLRKDIFLGLKEFVDEDVTACINDFNYLEILTKKTVSEKEFELRGTFNCTDHTYSLLQDAVYVAMHNRTNEEDSQHETFNAVLRTGLGLRDFFDYVLEDEADWFKSQEEALSLNALSAKSVRANRLEFSDSTFWMADSIKYQFWKRDTVKSENIENHSSIQYSSDKLTIKETTSEGQNKEQDYVFEGYNISETIVQFSGLKTIFYSNDCSITVELIERLYGDQVLGVHISLAGNTLHLYSYACPQPHIDKPFTFHVTYKNGIILAFSRNAPEVNVKLMESNVKVTSTKSILGSSSDRKKISMMDIEEFRFVMAASLPNGLTIQTVRGMKPCYIRQRFLSHPDETSRLFLPNGNVVKMMTDGNIQIFKMDTSIVSAKLNEFVENFSKYKIIDGQGDVYVIENGQVTSSKRCQVFRNSDLNSDRVYFRRLDGTNYMLQGDGTLCVKFGDGTKMYSYPLSEHIESETEYNILEDETIDEGYIIVYLIITVEHPDYVTTIFNSKTQKWKLRLPYESEIIVNPEGEYCVSIDKQTELIVQDNWLETLRFSTTDELLFHAVADLSAFNHENNAYVYAKDCTGKKFLVEANSNCYVEKCAEREAATTANDTQSTQIAFTSLLHKANTLTEEKRYFVIKKDLSGFELLHKNAIVKALTDIKNGSVVCTQTLPDLNLRCFVLITPSEKTPKRKWEVDSVIPDPTYVPQSGMRMTSSTYGRPPTWMHLFPKKKAKFQIPEHFSCRVFLEIKPTELEPFPNALDCSFCEVEEVEPKHTVLKDKKGEDYLRKLSNNNQDILREMYAIIAAGVINKSKRNNELLSDELTHYLTLSKYYVELQEYHKYCVRHHKVPKYFHHPVGMSWLILNNLVGRLTLRDQETSEVHRKASIRSPTSSQREDSYSSSDVEYDLSVRTCQSFSSLSYHSSKSGQTAPDIIETQGVSRCKVKPARDSTSVPAVNYDWEEKSEHRSKQTPVSESESESQTVELPPTVCDFSDSDFDLFDTMNFFKDERGTGLTFEDLMCLGLV